MESLLFISGSVTDTSDLSHTRNSVPSQIQQLPRTQ